jgi:regulator of protease activity HflC (stomatin/prohibitin superfamily)
MPQLIILVIFAILILLKSVKIVREHERLVIYRFGRLCGIAGPGLKLLAPFVDKGVKLNLKESFPGWQCLSPRELEEKIKEYMAYRPV